MYCPDLTHPVGGGGAGGGGGQLIPEGTSHNAAKRLCLNADFPGLQNTTQIPSLNSTHNKGFIRKSNNSFGNGF